MGIKEKSANTTLVELSKIFMQKCQRAKEEETGLYRQSRGREGVLFSGHRL